MPLRITQVDAFTDHPFSGNPAAVCVLSESQPDAWMQSVACEMNLSETAFLVKKGEGYDLRWFTPLVEVDLCGHATLASAHVLWEEGLLRPDQRARFFTRSGELFADRKGDWIELDFPVEEEHAVPQPEGLDLALGVQFSYVGLGKYHVLCEVESESMVRELKPDFTRLKSTSTHGVIVTARASSTDYDIVSRFFAPALGVDEDPVTGSAHCCLAAHWAPRLGKNDFIAHQASARGGIVLVGLRGERVRLGGQAVTVMKGEFLA